MTQAPKKDQHQFEIAKITISANLENQKGWRAHFQKSRRDYMIFWVVVIFFVLTFCCIAMFTGKDEIALEIIKGAVFLGAGGGAGYAYGFRKGQLLLEVQKVNHNSRYDVGERKRCDVPEELLHGVASFREACPTAGIYPNSSPEANEKPLPRWQGLVTKQDISIQSHSQGSTLFDNVVDNP